MQQTNAQEIMEFVLRKAEKPVVILNVRKAMKNSINDTLSYINQNKHFISNDGNHLVLILQHLGEALTLEKLHGIFLKRGVKVILTYLCIVAFLVIEKLLLALFLAPSVIIHPSSTINQWWWYWRWYWWWYWRN